MKDRADHNPFEQTVGRLIYCANGHRVQWQDLVLERSRPMVLRYHSGRAVSRLECHIRTRNVWLGGDSGTCADWRNGMEDIIVSQRWPLPGSHQSECPKKRKS